MGPQGDRGQGGTATTTQAVLTEEALPPLDLTSERASVSSGARASVPDFTTPSASNVGISAVSKYFAAMTRSVILHKCRRSS